MAGPSRTRWSDFLLYHTKAKKSSENMEKNKKIFFQKVLTNQIWCDIIITEQKKEVFKYELLLQVHC